MKSLDEVIKKIEKQWVCPSSDYADEYCELYDVRDDALHYLKEYRELTKELVERTKIDEKNGYSAGRHNEDCYWFDSVQDRGAHIPTCDYFGRLGYCPCDNCDKYITNRTISKIVKHIYESER